MPLSPRNAERNLYFFCFWNSMRYQLKWRGAWLVCSSQQNLRSWISTWEHHPSLLNRVGLSSLLNQASSGRTHGVSSHPNFGKIFWSPSWTSPKYSSTEACLPSIESSPVTNCMLWGDSSKIYDQCRQWATLPACLGPRIFQHRVAGSPTHQSRHSWGHSSFSQDLRELRDLSLRIIATLLFWFGSLSTWNFWLILENRFQTECCGSTS